MQVSASNPPACTMGPLAATVLPPVATRYLARQPILNTQGNVVAYELLFRNALENSFSGSGDMASQTMIDNTMIYGLGKLTTGLPAFINCTAETLSSEYIQMLPAPLTVVEVLEDVDPSQEVIDACIRLRQKGYRIALDDFEYRPALAPLIRIADFIKVDFRITPALERRKLMSMLREFKGVYLAEKVETRLEYEQALKEGFALFQGYYFCKPSLLKKSAVPANQFVRLQLLNLMQKDPLDISSISEVVKSEPSLTYRLLRYVNSAKMGMRDEVTSIKSALLVVGDNMFRRIATLAVIVELNAGHSPEILRIALTRARFCETVAQLCDLDPTEQYLLGLFSLLDAMLQTPMKQAIAPLSLAAPIKAALLGADNRYRCALRWLESHEHGDFAKCDELSAAHGFPSSLMVDNFKAAAAWADELLAEG